MAASQLGAYELAALRADKGDAKFAYTFLSQINKGWQVFRDTNNSDLKNRIIDESFEAPQWATRSRAADALYRTTARMTAISPELSDLARRIEMVRPAKEAVSRWRGFGGGKDSLGAADVLPQPPYSITVMVCARQTLIVLCQKREG
jgi:hypothetical protein